MTGPEIDGEVALLDSLLTPDDRVAELAARILKDGRIENAILAIKKEVTLARIDEARKVHGDLLTRRMRELAQELAELDRSLPNELRL